MSNGEWVINYRIIMDAEIIADFIIIIMVICVKWQKPFEQMPHAN